MGHGKPDMALFLFTKAMLRGEKLMFIIMEFDQDFTYVDDVVKSIVKIVEKPPIKKENFDKSNLSPEESWAPHKIFNVGNSNPIYLMDFLKVLEDNLSIKAKINFLPMQSGDVQATASDSSLLEKYIKFKPTTSVEEGIKKFVIWYKNFYGIEL